MNQKTPTSGVIRPTLPYQLAYTTQNFHKDSPPETRGRKIQEFFSIVNLAF